MWTSIGGGELLFYMPDDPEEQRNLAKSEPETARRMKRILTGQVGGYNPGLVRDGELIVKESITGPNDVDKWPGFHSTKEPSDVLH